MADRIEVSYSHRAQLFWQSPTHSNHQGGASHLPIALCTPDERKQRDQHQQQLVQQQLFAKSRARVDKAEKRRPITYERPAFNTPQYWRDCARGLITDDRQRQDHADFETRRRRALDSKQNRAAAPHRHLRPAPRATRQFSKPMSTQAARDDRLTPQSKALLQVLTARTGKGRFTDTTKTTLGIIMHRCPRSIQRYIQELIKFGYIRTQTRKSRRTGFFIGLRVWLMNSVLPFYARKEEHYNAEKWVTSSRTAETQWRQKSPLPSVKILLETPLGRISHLGLVNLRSEFIQTHSILLFNIDIFTS